MKSPAHNEAIDYALQVLRRTKDNGYKMNHPMEPFINISIPISAYLARIEASIDQ